MKYYNFILLIIILLLSCSIVAPQLNLEINGYNYEKSEYIKEYLPSDKEIEEQYNLKYNICPESFKTEWVIDRINYWISYYDFKDTNFHNLTDLYKNIVFDKVYFDIDDLSEEAKEKFPIENYNREKSNLNLVETVKKGDVILTRNVYYMNILLNSRYSLHHALLCINDPTSDDDLCLITSYPSDFPNQPENVCLVSLSYLKIDEFVVVLRCNQLDNENINKIVNYALSKIGCSYNNDYINKSKDDSFYCSQIVYKAYKSVGLDIDYNNNEWYDHGLVLPNDIYKSPYFSVIKYGN